MKISVLAIFVLVLISLTACMPKIYPPGEKNHTAHIGPGVFITEDGTQLPLRQWLPTGRTDAVLVALHGFNDYSHFFDRPGAYFSHQGIACFAYDQRGFGASSRRGLWAGESAYTHDLKVLSELLKQHYPNRPLYLLGESMGAAVVIAAMGKTAMPNIDGIILSAPALWSRSTMPWYQTSVLWALAHSMPWLTLSGRQVKITPSDNIDMLRALGKDPWVIKKTRVDTIHGLTDLMDSAFGSAPLLQGDTLLLYGEKDEIIPKQPTYQFLQTLLSNNPDKKMAAIYQHGYHMLLRDLQAVTTWKDIAAWIADKSQKLPSGADSHAQQVLAKFIAGATTK